MARYDIAIIGTGPGGVSAAITSVIRKKNIILFGSKELSDKVAKAHQIQNYPGLPAVSGANLAAAYRKHLDEMGIEITEDRVTLMYHMGDYFAIQTAKNQMYEADTVILATGVVQGKPYPGEDEFLGRGVSYCATCDAPLYRGKSAIVVGFAPKEETEAELLAEYADKVTYIPMYKEEVHIREDIEVKREKPVSIEGDMKASRLVTDQGSYETDGIFLLRESVAPGKLLPGLEISGAHVVVDRSMATNIPGCFACGDITGTPYQYIKAAGEGNVAALSAAAFLDAKRRGER